MTLTVEPAARLAEPARARGLTYLPATAFVLDLGVIVASIAVAALARRHLSLFVQPADVSDSVALTGPLLAGLWLLCVGLLGGYSRSTFGAGADEFKSVARGSAAAAAGVGIACYLASYELSRGFYVLAFVIGLPALMLGRGLLRRALYRARRRGVMTQRVLIAGSPAHIDEVAGVLLRESWLGYDIIGALTPAHDLSESTALGIPVLGSAEDVASIAEETGPDVLLIAGGAYTSANQMRRVAWDLEQHAVQVVVAPSLTDVSRERVKVRPVGGLPLMHLEGPRALHASRWAKRSFDLVGSGLLILMLSPVLLAVAAIDQAARPRPRAVPPDPGRPRRRRVRLLQVPHDGGGRRGAARRLHQRAGLRRRAVQDGGRPAHHQARALAAPLLARRAAPAVQRLRRRHEPGRPPPAAAARGGALRGATRTAGCGCAPA